MKLKLLTRTFYLDVRAVGRDTIEPILTLLKSPDIEVQRAAGAALGNLAVNCMKYAKLYIGYSTTDKAEAWNKLLIVRLGGVEQLIALMQSPSVEVQCNAVGCITNLATHGKIWLYC